MENDTTETTEPKDPTEVKKRKVRFMSTANWIALGGLIVAVLTLYFNINLKDESNTPTPDPVFPVEPDPSPIPEPKIIKGNALIVESSIEDYKGFFANHASEVLNQAGIQHRSGGAANSEHRIIYAYNLKKTSGQSGIREAFKYSLSVNVKVLTNDGEVCFSKTYYSKKPRIGYPEDGEDIIESKILLPLLKEVEENIKIDQQILC